MKVAHWVDAESYIQNVAARSLADAEPYIREIAKRSRLEDHVVYGDASRVHRGPATGLNDAVLNVSSGEIIIREAAFFGHGVSLLTGTHDIAARGAERHGAYPRTGRDIVIGEGVWIASNATVLGPCTIGAHAVVAAGAIVTGDVEPGAIVAGVPARRIGSVPESKG